MPFLAYHLLRREKPTDTGFIFGKIRISPPMMQRSIDRSATYNNAGVRLMTAGNHNAALELFRGALESKLSFERRSFSGREAPPMERCVTPDMNDIAPCSSSSSSTSSIEGPSSTTSTNLDSYLELSRNTEAGPQHLPQQSHFLTFNDGISMTISIPSTLPTSGGGGYEPYLYTKPFAVPEETNESSSSTTQAMSCRIVFNLALIHQMVCRSSAKAASFYEIAATLLSSLPDEQDEEIFVLRLVLLNNFGVWCFENAEGESMMACFEQLVETLQIEDDDGMSSLSIDPSILSGIQRNIQAFLTPMNGVSLAA